MSTFVAALPMYDWPEVRAETDAEWAVLRDGLRIAGIDAPETLVRCNRDIPAVPSGIRDADGALVAPDPATLPPDDLDVHVLWRHPQLLLAQTCWGPMELGLGDHVRVIGRPDYSAFEGGEGIYYRSAIVMRRGNTPPSGLPAISPSRGETDFSSTPEVFLAGAAASKSDAERTVRPTTSVSPLEGEMAGRPEGGMDFDVSPPNDEKPLLPVEVLRGLRFAYNEADSMSGIIGLRRDLVTVGAIADEAAFGAFWSEMIVSGGHRQSVIAVAENRADVAAIDCRTLDLCLRFEPAIADLRIAGWTAKRKGLPYVASKALPEGLAEKLARVLAG